MDETDRAKSGVTDPDPAAAERELDEDARRAAATQEPDAGETTGDEPGKTTEVPEREQGAEAWAALPDWAREQIINSRRASRTMREQAMAHGWAIDDHGTWHPPEPIAPARREAPTVTKTETGLAPDREAYFERRYREAELNDDPEKARMRVNIEMSTEIAGSAADAALTRGLKILLPTQLRPTVDSYKTTFRADPVRGDAFKQAEPEFDKVIAEAHKEAEAVGRPLILTPEIMDYFRAVAIDRALPKVLAAAGVRKGVQTDAAKAAAGQFETAKGSTRTPIATAPSTSAQEDSILTAISRGGGVDEGAVKKGYSERKARGE